MVSSWRWNASSKGNVPMFMISACGCRGNWYKPETGHQDQTNFRPLRLLAVTLFRRHRFPTRRQLPLNCRFAENPHNGYNKFCSCWGQEYLWYDESRGWQLVLRSVSPPSGWKWYRKIANIKQFLFKNSPALNLICGPGRLCEVDRFGAVTGLIEGWVGVLNAFLGMGSVLDRAQDTIKWPKVLTNPTLLRYP